jgi:mannose-1-phosphate guanylyltransferase
VEVAGSNVVRIAGRGPGAVGATPWHFTGVHVLSPRVFDFLSPEGPEDINHHVYPRMLQAGLSIRAAVQRAPWSDLGTPARYLAAQRGLLRDLPAPVLVEPDALVDPSATVGDDVYVGSRARVGAGARLTRCAVLADAVIAPGEALAYAIAWEDRRL